MYHPRRPKFKETIMEQWKDIAGFEGKYQVSNLGRVKSLKYHRANKEKTLAVRGAVRRGKERYFYVTLSKDNKTAVRYVHRLVAECFVNNPDNKPYVNHKDGDIHNNNADNLEWVTPLENNIHAMRILGRYPHKGFKFDKCKASKKVCQIYISEEGYRYHLATYANAVVSSLITGISEAEIRQCCKGKRKQAGGYIWQYVEQSKTQIQ